MSIQLILQIKLLLLNLPSIIAFKGSKSDTFAIISFWMRFRWPL